MSKANNRAAADTFLAVALGVLRKTLIPQHYNLIFFIST